MPDSAPTRACGAVLSGRDTCRGADSTIAYLPEEEEDAQNTKKEVEELGARCHLIAVDLAKRENCQKVVDFAVEKMGAIDVLFNNAACK